MAARLYKRTQNNHSNSVTLPEGFCSFKVPAYIDLKVVYGTPALGPCIYNIQLQQPLDPIILVVVLLAPEESETNRGL